MVTIIYYLPKTDGGLTFVAMVTIIYYLPKTDGGLTFGATMTMVCYLLTTDGSQKTSSQHVICEVGFHKT